MSLPLKKRLHRPPHMEPPPSFPPPQTEECSVPASTAAPVKPLKRRWMELHHQEQEERKQAEAGTTKEESQSHQRQDRTGEASTTNRDREAAGRGDQHKAKGVAGDPKRGPQPPVRRPSQIDDFEDALFTELPPVANIKPEERPQTNGNRKAHEQDQRGAAAVPPKAPPHKRLKQQPTNGSAPQPTTAAANAQGSNVKSSMHRKPLSERGEASVKAEASTAPPPNNKAGRRPSIMLPDAGDELSAAAGTHEEQERPLTSATEKAPRGIKRPRLAGNGNGDLGQNVQDAKRSSHSLTLDCILEAGTNNISGAPTDSNGLKNGTSATPRQPGVGSCFTPQGSHSAPVQLGKLRSFDELHAAVQNAFAPGLLPAKPKMKLVYLDADGDWMLLTKTDSWAAFCATARRLLVTDRC